MHCCPAPLPPCILYVGDCSFVVMNGWIRALLPTQTHPTVGSSSRALISEEETHWEPPSMYQFWRTKLIGNLPAVPHPMGCASLDAGSAFGVKCSSMGPRRAKVIKLDSFELEWTFKDHLVQFPFSGQGAVSSLPPPFQ